MPDASYTPTATFRVPSIIPDGPAPASEVWRDALDALTAAQSALTGLMVWAPRMYTSGTRSGGAASDTGVYVGAIPKVVLADPDGTVRVHAVAATQLNTGTHAAGALGTSSNFYVYVYVASNGAAPTFLITGTAPAANMVWHPSQATYRYVGSFTTNAAGDPRPFRMAGGRYLYEIDGGDVLADFTVYSGDPGGVQQDLSLQGLIPSTSGKALIRWVAYSTGASKVFSMLQGAASPSAYVTLDAPTAPGGGTSFNTETTELPVAPYAPVSSVFNTISITGNGGGVASVDVYALGYEEALA